MATWYKTNCPYRTKITLTNSSSLVEDDSYLIEVDTATLYSAGKCRGDCDDIVFTRIDDPTPLTRYILPGTENTSTTSIYVRIMNLDAGDTDIYMYYGSLIHGENQALVEYYKELKGSVEITGNGGGYYRDIYKTVIEEIDGSRTVFTVEDEGYLDESLVVYLRGQQLLKDIDFWEATPASGVFEFATPPYVGDDIWAEYYDSSAIPAATPEYWWSTLYADTGSSTPDSQGDSFTFEGGDDIETTITGKKVTIDYIGTSTDELVKVSDDDTTASTLDDKVVAGTDISVTVLNPGGNEQLEIAYAGSGGGAWEVIDSYTVSGSPVSRVTFSGINDSLYFCYELKLMIKNDHATDGAYGLLFFNDIEFTGEDDKKIKRQKYYATNTTWTLGREKTAYIFGCFQSTESYTNAEFSRPGGTDVYAKLESIHQSDTSGYPRAYISFSRYINIGATISKVAVVCFKAGTATETALMYEGTSIVLLGLKKT